MRTFLQETAAVLHARYGADLSSLTLLFPSRRARHFFVDALSELTDRPLWRPHWLTIDELAEEISGLTAGDRVRLVAELYKIYAIYHDEPFDKFYFWGEMLLSDFDSVDKYLIRADDLFRNLYELKEIESDLSYLSDEQRKVIRSFWNAFAEGLLSDEKQQFLALWRSLAPIYRRFRKRLAELGIAYGGMIQRAAVERLERGDYEFRERRQYVVVGFNALSECEKRLFRYLQTACGAQFFWDYDDYYTAPLRAGERLKENDQEAGLFVRRNLASFAASGEISHDNFLKNKDITVVSAVSNAAQCKYASTVLSELSRSGRLDKHTAVVLTDENLLVPLLYSLPGDTGPINVTMGYPLKQTLAYAFLERLIELQLHAREEGGGVTFYHVDVSGILSHPYIRESDDGTIERLRADIVSNRRIRVAAADLCRNDLLRRLFSFAADWRSLSDHLSEAVAAVARISGTGDDARRRTAFLSLICEHINQLGNSLLNCDIDIDISTYASLLRRQLQTLRIPYEGEPLEGLQVMGILETRNLDFKEVILLSMNDDNFPGSHAARPSFIPYNLRAAYGLPTHEEHEAVYAYYFYRLIQRAERVWLVYCSRADEKTTGEPSRYIYQLDYESGFALKRVEAGIDANLSAPEAIVVPKGERIRAQLCRFTDSENPVQLSPTAFSRYIACPLKFYFYSLARIQNEDALREEVDAPMFGTILHAAMQRLYGGIRGERPPGEILRRMARSDEIDRAVIAAINREYFCREGENDADFSGNLMLVRDIVIRYIRNGVVPYDVSHDAFRVCALEHPVGCDFAFGSAGERRRVRFGGIADRIDVQEDGVLRVVDYKTGEAHLEFAGVASLFEGANRQRQANLFQTLLYSMILSRTEGRETMPALYYVRRMNRPDYAPWLIDRESGRNPIRYTAVADTFERLLREKLGELFDPSVPFRQCDDPQTTCRFCDYRTICRR